MPIPRRSFIKYASLAAAGNLAGLHPFGALNALADTTEDYKALVCVFLYGGNDANNMIVPFDKTGYASYSAARGPLALTQNSLLPLNPLPNFALHPGLSDVQSLFNSGKAALVANVGTLVQPLTRTEYVQGRNLPSSLFSHSDQQAEWQNGTPDTTSRTGWAGRVADVLASYNGSADYPMITSTAGDSVFCDGMSTSPMTVSPGNLGVPVCSEAAQCSARQSSAQALVTLNSGISLVSADNQITGNAYKYPAVLTAAMKSSKTLATAFPSTSLGKALKQIAQIIQVRTALGVKRQIFFASLGGFDTHADQLDVHASLMGALSTALSAFYQSTQEMGVAEAVTTFTMSDFSRTLQPNSRSGSDHAWGSHHIVLGGAVKGGKMYGTFPTLALAGPDDSDSTGRWIPTTATAQYAATFAQWFGVPTNRLTTVLPNLPNFPKTNLGFV